MKTADTTKYESTICLDSADTLIIMDTNAWIDIYSYHPIAIEEIVKCLDDKSDLIYVPHQVWMEFNRNSAIQKQRVNELYKKACSESLEELYKAKDKIIARFTSFEKMRRNDGTKLKNKIDAELLKIAKDLHNGYDTLKQNYDLDMAIISKENDIVYDLIKKIYEKNKDADFTIVEKMNICEEGEIRYKYNQAPGFTDITKDEFGKIEFWRKYGDLVLWKEMLRKVSGTDTNVIFIEDEKKKDWFEVKGGKKLSAILYEEYAEATRGKGKIEVCDFLSFIENYGESLGLLDSQMNILIDKLKFERSVIENVHTKKEELLLEKLERYFDDMYNISQIFDNMSSSYFGGTFEDFDDSEIEGISIEEINDIEYERALGIFNISSKFVISGNGMLIEYVSKDVNHSGYIDFKMSGSITLDLEMLFDDLDDPKQGYDVVKEEVFVTQLDVTRNDFDIDIKYNA